MTTLRQGDTVRVGKGKLDWTVTGLYPLDPKGQTVPEPTWATVTTRTNRHGIWYWQVKRIRDLSTLTKIDGEKN